MNPSLDRSYRALLKLPSVGRILLGMQIARIGQSMVSVALVLFTLTAYRSAKLAGVATFFNLFPGLLVSPIAGALLDRHGRTRLVVLDYFVALAALALIGALALTGALPPGLLILIAGILGHHFLPTNEVIAIVNPAVARDVAKKNAADLESMLISNPGEHVWGQQSGCVSREEALSHWRRSPFQREGK